MEPVTLDEIQEEMYRMVAHGGNTKVLTPSDLVRTTLLHFKDRGASRKLCRRALKSLMESGRCVYGYYCDTYVTLPQVECSHPDHGEESL